MRSRLPPLSEQEDESDHGQKTDATTESGDFASFLIRHHEQDGENLAEETADGDRRCQTTGAGEEFSGG